MKKIFMRSTIVLAVFLAFYSCQKDEFTEDDALRARKDLITHQDSIEHVRDSLEKLGGIIQYSINIVAMDGNSAMLKSSNGTNGLAGAAVSVAQHGIVQTDTADESGIVVFNDLRVGTVSVSVRAENYTNVDFVAEIRPENDPNVNIYYDVLRYAATMVPVFSLTEGTSKISGVVSLETDLTNRNKETAEGITVIGKINADSIKADYFDELNHCVECEKYYASVVTFAYGDLVATAKTDAQGKYELNMPSTANGLPIEIEVSDWGADQRLLQPTYNGERVFGVQTIRTIFGTGITASEIAPNANKVDSVHAAYVEFTAPEGSAAAQVEDPATAKAVVGKSGLSAVTIKEQGEGYTQAPLLKVTDDISGGETGIAGEGAEVKAYITDGRLTKVEVVEEGFGYTNPKVEMLKFGEDYGRHLVAEPVVSYGVDTIRINPGTGYEEAPKVIISSNSGAGATAVPVLDGYVDDVVVISNQGSNYTNTPKVLIKDKNGNVSAQATANMTESNPLHSIVYDGTLAATFEEVPLVKVSSVTGSGAKAIAELKGAGKVKRIEILDGGSGYEEAPSVLVTGGDGVGATAWATIDANGVVDGVVIGSEGDGYTTAPTIVIASPENGGTTATAEAFIEKELEKITLTNPGSGFNWHTNAGSYSGDAVDVVLMDPKDVYTDISISARVDVFASQGVKSVTIGEGGAGYTDKPEVIFESVDGNGSGAQATASLKYNIKELEVTSSGSGYLSDGTFEVAIITPETGCETAATLDEVVFAYGTLEKIILKDGGEGYTAPPHVFLKKDADGEIQQVKIQALVSNGKATELKVVDGGMNLDDADYVLDPTISIVDAEFTAEGFKEAGKISFVTIDNPGSGYTVAPQVIFLRKSGTAFVSDNSFVKAEATAVIKDGRVVEINVTNPGTGYYETPEVKLYIPTYVETAKGWCNVSANGQVTGVTLFTGCEGAGYLKAPTVTFYASVPGYGKDAEGVAILNESGQVKEVKMINQGTGYVGQNYPTVKQNVSLFPANTPGVAFRVEAGKAYLRDIYLGTGYRTIAQ